MNKKLYDFEIDEAPAGGFVVQSNIKKVWCDLGTGRKWAKQKANRKSRRNWKEFLNTGVEPRNLEQVLTNWDLD